MKLPLIAATVLVLFGAGVADPLGAVAARERERLVAGRGVADPENTLPFAFEFKARGTPEQATGRAESRTVAPEPYVGDVKCLAVKGKRAAISGTFRQPTPNGQYFLLVVRDNGPAQDPPTDTLAVEVNADLVPCEQALGETGDPIREGNIRVR